MPETSHIYLKKVRLAYIILTPDLLQYLVRGNYPVSVACQIRQQSILSSRQIYLVTTQGDPVSRKVYHQVIGRERRLGMLIPEGSAPQY